ncbi:DUF6622 family protein [Paraburkholderia terricola]|nr:DUF6622 family protein [Paraburkholderia terricola]MDR6484904.1 hypothetical protein [Paraburkholderia terricola]
MNHVPHWVLVLFVALLVIGLRQSRTHVASRGRLLVMPLIMAALSLNALIRLFGADAWACLFWVGALVAPIVVRRRFSACVDAVYLEQERKFRIAGSWIPLGLMMAIFALRFAATMVAHMRLVEGGGVALGFALGFGVLSGAFVARSILIFGKAYGRRDSLSDMAGAIDAPRPFDH